MDNELNSVEISLARAALKNKSVEELELYLSLANSLSGDDWSYGKALSLVAKQLILEKMEKVLLEDK